MFNVDGHTLSIANREWGFLQMAGETDLASEQAKPQTKRYLLSKLLKGIERLISEKASMPLWVLAEVSSATCAASGHLYLDLVEHDADGQKIASARGVAWRAQAIALRAKFRNDTGDELKSGLKVLLLVRARFSAAHGFTLQIDDIDPSFTLGEMEARKRRIRASLAQEGIADKNRRLPRPTDFFRVAVIAPAGAAGLGDFQAHARLLEAHAVCQFLYFGATFQGATAQASICSAIEQVLMSHQFENAFDALVIIRGGGAVTDLDYLNSLEIARAVCEAPMPVLVGIGHERDNTIVDEVACWRFDTPSKVIAGIENTIRSRAQSACNSFERIRIEVTDRVARAARFAETLYTDVGTRATGKAHRLERIVEADYGKVCRFAQGSVSDRRRRIDLANKVCRMQARALVETARESAKRQMEATAERAVALARGARWQAERHHETVSSLAGGKLREEARECEYQFRSIIDEIHLRVWMAGTDIDDALAGVGPAALRLVKQAQDKVTGLRDGTRERIWARIMAARTLADSHFRSIFSLGPTPTLERGFVIARSPDGKPITTVVAARAATVIDLQFRDGTTNVRTEDA